MATSYPFSHIAVIGIGLIGTSIVHAAKYRNLPVTFAAYDNNPDVRAEAADLLSHIKITTTLQQAIEDAELVILAVPVGVMEQVIKDIAPYLRPGCVITDTGQQNVPLSVMLSLLFQRPVILSRVTPWQVQNFQALQLDLPACLKRAIG